MTQANPVRLAMEGSSQAFGELYRLYHKRLYAYACICLRSGALAEEAVQDTALIAWREIPRLRSEAQFEHWLFKILANRCRLIARKEARVIPLDENDTPAPAAPDSLALSQETRDALDTLPFDEREIVLLCVLTGLSGREAARLLNINYSTLRSKRSRALTKLRGLLSD
ncbi:MAG: RNA polymerase sigma factor [Clostridium sp.]|jgi:RNA polymerase sigma-70 factor (ECF subfamily)|nr:RNA polymerase sigma factor [Clostridium sp.]